MKLKALQSEYPQIDAVMEYDDSPEFAADLIEECAKRFTKQQIAAHVGISRRYLSYMKQRGIKSFPIQLALEIMAGRKVLGDQ